MDYDHFPRAIPPVLHYCSANDQPRWMNPPESQRFSSAWRQNQIFFRTSKSGKPSRAFPLDQGGKAFVDQFPELLLSRQELCSCDKIIVKRYSSPHGIILFASKTASYWGPIGWAFYCLPVVGLSLSFHVFQVPVLRLSSACGEVLGGPRKTGGGPESGGAAYTSSSCWSSLLGRSTSSTQAMGAASPSR